jgi:hypothetical protein
MLYINANGFSHLHFGVYERIKKAIKCDISTDIAELSQLNAFIRQLLYYKEKRGTET